MIVALKEIRLEHEEGAPCTAIREGNVCYEFFAVELALSLHVSLMSSFTLHM